MQVHKQDIIRKTLGRSVGKNLERKQKKLARRLNDASYVYQEKGAQRRFLQLVTSAESYHIDEQQNCERCQDEAYTFLSLRMKQSIVQGIKKLMRIDYLSAMKLRGWCCKCHFLLKIISFYLFSLLD